MGEVGVPNAVTLDPGETHIKRFKPEWWLRGLVSVEGMQRLLLETDG